MARFFTIGRWFFLVALALLINSLFFLAVPLLDAMFSPVPSRETKTVESLIEVEVAHRSKPPPKPQKIMRQLSQDLKTFKASPSAPGAAKGLQMDLSLAGVGEGDGVAVGGSGMANMVYDPSEVEDEAKVIKEVTPSYPVRARREGISGYVRMYLVIDAHGNVAETQVLVVEPQGYGFETEAIKAMRAFKFSPARIKTVPVAQKATKEFVFDLGY